MKLDELRQEFPLTKELTFLDHAATSPLPGRTREAMTRFIETRRFVDRAWEEVEFLTGFKNDLKSIGELCRARGIYFVVDGIQSLGVIPLDVRECQIDLLSCGGPKWLMGPCGEGYTQYGLSSDLQAKAGGDHFRGDLLVV